MEENSKSPGRTSVMLLRLASRSYLSKWNSFWTTFFPSGGSFLSSSEWYDMATGAGHEHRGYKNLANLGVQYCVKLIGEVVEVAVRACSSRWNDHTQVVSDILSVRAVAHGKGANVARLMKDGAGGF